MTDLQQEIREKKPTIGAAILILLLLIGLGAFFINFYVAKERSRDLQQWDSRLGLVADARAQAIQEVVSSSIKGLSELADNASLQLYLWQTIQARDDEPQAEPPAQLSYLRNLLMIAAERHSYAFAGTARVPVNLPQTFTSGLALLDHDLKSVVMTPGMPVMNDAFLAAALLARSAGTSQTSALQLDENGNVLVAFAVPVRAVLGAGSNDSPTIVGVLIGVKDAARSLFPVMTRGAPFAERSETLLLEKHEAKVVYLSPTQDGAEPLKRSMPLERVSLAAAQAVLAPGQFILASNYAGQPVLQISRRIAGQNWVIAQQVDARQALRESNERRNFLITVLSLLLLSLTAIAIAAWRHGSSVRAHHQADELREQAARLQRQTELLHTVTDNVDTLTVLISRDDKVIFANAAAARAIGCTISELRGNSLGATFGPNAARALGYGIDILRHEKTASSLSLPITLGTETRTYLTSFIPVARIGAQTELVLLVLSDVTDLQLSQDKYAGLLRTVITTLAHIIDLHDPYSAYHSARMTEVSKAIGAELRISTKDRRTLDFAATLANVGKIMIPRGVLLKTSPLDDDEKDLLKTHVEKGIELLKNLDFEGPVLSTIAQKQEYMDGSGYPRALTEDQMTMPGKILSVANTFVAMVSPRAWRDAIPVNEVLDQMMHDSGRVYDRHVVAALLHVAENRLDWSKWNLSDIGPD